MKNYICEVCAQVREVKADKRGTLRRPKGWLSDSLCAACKSAKYVVRSAELPVTSPDMPENRDEVRAVLLDAWREATALANWAVGRMIGHEPGEGKMAPTYLYGEFGEYPRREAWTGGTGSAAMILRSVDNLYRQERKGTVFQRTRSVRSYRLPYPLPLDADDYKIYQAEDKSIWAEVKIPVAGWLKFKLRGGVDSGRFHQLINGQAIPREGALLLRRVRGSQTGFYFWLRKPGGGPADKYRLVIKIAGLFPKKDNQAEGEKVLTLRTDKEHLWVAQHPDRDEPFVVNADHVRGWVIAHEKYLQRASEDTKFERRFPKQKRLKFKESIEVRCEKQHHRLKSFRQMVSSEIVGYCKRQGITQIIYDDIERSYFPSFPWAALIESLQHKCEENNILLACKKESEE